jgi:methionine sulfoxide reductase heme-binding subunit
MPIIAAIGGLLIAIAVFAFAIYGITEEAVRVVARATVRVSVTLFLLTFAASALHSLFNGPRSAWLLAKRRAIGLSFALAHYAHLIALIVMGAWFYPLREEIGPAEIIGGGLAYLFILVMAATSNNWSVGFLGARRWKILHSIGAWYLWISFTQAYVPRAFADPIYIPFAAALIAAPLFRIAAGIAKRRARSAIPRQAAV